MGASMGNTSLPETGLAIFRTTAPPGIPPAGNSATATACSISTGLKPKYSFPAAEMISRGRYCATGDRFNALCG